MVIHKDWYGDLSGLIGIYSDLYGFIGALYGFIGIDKDL